MSSSPLNTDTDISLHIKHHTPIRTYKAIQHLRQYSTLKALFMTIK